MIVRRCLAVAAMLAVIMRILCGCDHPQSDIYEKMDELCRFFDAEHPEAGRYILIAENEREGYQKRGRQELGRMYSGIWKAPTCESVIAEYAVRLCADERGFEIHAIRCFNASDTEEVAEMLYGRIKMLTDAEIREYAPESFAVYYQGSEIFVYRDTVYLLATPDNAAAKRLIKK